MNDYEMIEAALRNGMYEGNMHACLRDYGRLAGGCLTAGRLSLSDVASLERIAVDLSKNKDEGLRKWRSAVEYGRKEPAYEDILPTKGGHAFSWDTEFSADDYKIVRDEWLETETLESPASFDPCRQLMEYMQSLFEPDEFVGYVTETFERDERLIPTKGVYMRTAGEIIEKLRQGRFDDAVGTVNENAGAWIRFNPLDGKGVNDSNVTSFRYALVECDKMPVERQIAIYRKLELPCKFIVHSGGKSAHAIVKIDADSLAEYRKRVDFLYEVCKRNGLEIDRQNRNPSRLSRLPGAMRNGNPQYIVARNTGKADWEEWKNWIEDLNDDLPDIEDATFATDEKLPKLADELIEGILRQGHKMRVTGPSKAGKSFLLLELAICIAEGGKWLGRRCRQGAVLYINLELDGASCYHRIHDLYNAMGITPNHRDKLKVWNLRGRTLPLDKLAPKIIRRCAGIGLAAIIIDPIYKVLTGDENAAADMAQFCNFFDRIARDCKCSVIDCHHHSKGSQGGKRSMDRASGSGVFARDPDALLDMIELDADKAKKAWLNDIECRAMARALDCDAEYGDTPEDWRTKINFDAMLVADEFIAEIERQFKSAADAAREARVNVRKGIDFATAWRIEPTLREFPPFESMDIWFKYPTHEVDSSFLKDAIPIDAEATWQRQSRAKKKVKPDVATATKNALDEFFQNKDNRSISVADLVEKVKEMTGGKGTEDSVRKAAKIFNDYFIHNGEFLKNS